MAVMKTHRSAHIDVDQQHAPARVLLIDSENFFGGNTPRPRLLRAQLTALLFASGPVHHAFATSDTSDALASVLAEHRVAPLTVSPGRDAAEDALLAHARRVHDSLGRCCGWSPLLITPCRAR